MRQRCASAAPALRQLILSPSIRCHRHPIAYQAASKKSLWDMGLHIFREQLHRRPEVSTKTVEGLLKLIDGERRGDQAERVKLSAMLVGD